MPPKYPQGFISAKQWGERNGISTEMANYYLRTGRLPYTKMGNWCLVKEDAQLKPSNTNYPVRRQYDSDGKING